MVYLGVLLACIGFWIGLIYIIGKICKIIADG